MITIAKIILDIVVATIVGLCGCFIIAAICNFFRMPLHSIFLVVGVTLIIVMITSPLWSPMNWWIALPTAAFMAWKVVRDYREIKASAKRAAAEVAARG